MNLLAATAATAAVGLAVISQPWKATVYCLCCLAFTLVVECSVMTWRGR
jgi:hypothetical protein